MKKLHARVNSQWFIHDMFMKFLINIFSLRQFHFIDELCDFQM